MDANVKDICYFVKKEEKEWKEMWICGEFLNIGEILYSNCIGWVILNSLLSKFVLSSFLCKRGIAIMLSHSVIVKELLHIKYWDKCLKHHKNYVCVYLWKFACM